jgi:hypothetical protein
MRPAWIETGTVANVNAKNMTLDWVSQYTGKQIPDVQWMSSYVHYSNGEGFTCVPEVGALCALCFPSDDDPPFVLGFLTGPELIGADAGDLQEKVEDPGVENEEDLPQSQTTQAGGTTSPTANPSDASFRGGRPILNPGDMYWQGRNENFVVLRRGGVLQLGSTQICQRVYIPVGNIIRDFCENYELNTAAGTLSWQVKRNESNPSGNAPSEFELISRENAQDKYASVKVMIGTPRDDKAKKKLSSGNNAFIELVLAPQKIDPNTGEVSGKGVFVIRVDKEGNSFVYQAGDRDEEVGNDTVTVRGAQNVEVAGARTIKSQSESKELQGNQDVKGAASTETWSGTKTIAAAQLLLGGTGASEPGVLGLKLAAWLSSHTHTVTVPPGTAVVSTPPMTAQALPDAILSTKVKLL